MPISLRACGRYSVSKNASSARCAGRTCCSKTAYLPHARKEIGVASVPNGRKYYEYLVRRHTTTTLTPEQIHALGMSEVARIRARMDAVIATTGFKGTFPEFLKRGTRVEVETKRCAVHQR